MEINNFLFNAYKRALKRNGVIHLCEVCQKKTDYYYITGNKGLEFWYCKEHAKIENYEK